MKTTTQLSVDGMTCGGCVASVKRVLLQVPGVTQADVALAPGLAAVTFDDRQADVPALVAAIERAGFTASASRP